MSEAAKFARVIRINIIGGTIMVGTLILSGSLTLVGFLPADAGSIAYRLVFGGVPAFLMFLTAWLARRERAQAAAASGASGPDHRQAG